MRVLIADNQPTVRHALSVWISGQTGWEVVAECGDSFNLLEKYSQYLPEVVILDRDLPGKSSAELVTSLRLTCKKVTVILLFNGELEQCNAESPDADYYISKIDPPARIMEAILKAKRCLDDQSISKKDRDHE